LRPRGLVVAIDGPSGAGKSTAGRALAERLGYTYIDTGAMYRALGLKALHAGASLDSDAELSALSRTTRIELVEGGRQVLLDGADVTAEIRSPEVSAAASRVSTHGGVRRDMVERQRALGGDGGVVLDGRDIGTAVFPDAEVKFYLDADPSQRARRRHAELQRAGAAVSLEAVEREVRARDHNDTHRAESPLVRAPDAVDLDTTGLSTKAVIERMLAIVRARAANPLDLARLLAGPAGRERYRELLRAPALSLGLYRLPAGSLDEQQPHGEDEVYYTLSGRGRLRVGEADHAVEPGTLHFVAARAEHRFHSITEDLALLVFFAPAEGTARGTGG
jgi:cytidylate kinase